MAQIEDRLQHPWWLVHRAHLHTGLADVARREGAELITDARASAIAEHELPEGDGNKTRITTERQDAFVFDLCVVDLCVGGRRREQRGAEDALPRRAARTPRPQTVRTGLSCRSSGFGGIRWLGSWSRS